MLLTILGVIGAFMSKLFIAMKSMPEKNGCDGMSWGLILLLRFLFKSFLSKSDASKLNDLL